jgi:hypothetical protein
VDQGERCIRELPGCSWRNGAAEERGSEEAREGEEKPKRVYRVERG